MEQSGYIITLILEFTIFREKNESTQSTLPILKAWQHDPVKYNYKVVERFMLRSNIKRTQGNLTNIVFVAHNTKLYNFPSFVKCTCGNIKIFRHCPLSVNNIILAEWSCAVTSRAFSFF